METIDWIVLTSYFIVLVFIILKVKKVQNIEDFAVAGRKVPSPIIFATLTASIVGPGYIIGLSDKGYTLGYVFYLITLMFAFQTIFTAYFIAPKISSYKNAYTLGDILGLHYGNAAKKISGVLSFLYCAGIVGVVAKASGDLISYFTGINFVLAAILSTIIVIIYSTHGGIKAVVVSDVLQFIIIIAVVPIIIYFIMADIDFENFESVYKSNFENFSGGLSNMQIAGLLFSFLLGEALVPPYVSRALMAKSPKHAKKGFLYSGLFMVIWFFIAISIGVFGKVLLDDGSSVFFDLLAKYAPVGILGLIAAALISIIMSTKDSFLNSASVIFTFDILSKDRKKKNLKTTQFINMLTGTIAVLFALSIPNIMDAIVNIFTFWAPTVVLPLMIAVLKKNVHPLSGLLAIIAGLLVTSIWEFALPSPPFGIPSVIAGVIANQVVFWLVETINPNIGKSKQNDIKIKTL